MVASARAAPGAAGEQAARAHERAAVAEDRVARRCRASTEREQRSSKGAANASPRGASGHRDQRRAGAHVASPLHPSSGCRMSRWRPGRADRADERPTTVSSSASSVVKVGASRPRRRRRQHDGPARVTVSMFLEVNRRQGVSRTTRTRRRRFLEHDARRRGRYEVVRNAVRDARQAARRARDDDHGVPPRGARGEGRVESRVGRSASTGREVRHRASQASQTSAPDDENTRPTSSGPPPTTAGVAGLGPAEPTTGGRGDPVRVPDKTSRSRLA